MSANETFIPSTITYSVYATYDVGKLKLKLRERENMRWSGIKVLSAWGWKGVPYKTKADFISSHFFSFSEPSVLALAVELGLWAQATKIVSVIYFKAPFYLSINSYLTEYMS